MKKAKQRFPPQVKCKRAEPSPTLQARFAAAVMVVRPLQEMGRHGRRIFCHYRTKRLGGNIVIAERQKLAEAANNDSTLMELADKYAIAAVKSMISPASMEILSDRIIETILSDPFYWNSAEKKSEYFELMSKIMSDIGQKLGIPVSGERSCQ